MKPPNYRDGSTTERCGNCGAFKLEFGSKVQKRTDEGVEGFCTMYGVNVHSRKVCDKWYPKKVRITK